MILARIPVYYRWILFNLLLLIIQMPVNSQVDMNFEDSLLTGWTQDKNSRWEISGNYPLIGDFSLHHAYDNPSSGKDRISYSLHNLEPDSGLVTWDFVVRHEYSPSSANNWSFFLMSDKDAMEMYPGGDLNALVMGVNYTGSSDFVSLWKIIDGDASVFLETGFNYEENVSTSGIVNFEVTRTLSGLWEIKIDTSGNFNYQISIGSTMDSWLMPCRHFGIYYEYSSSQDRKLWIDDISIQGSFFIDTIPPEIDSLSVYSSQALYIRFNEPVNTDSALDTINYLIDHGTGCPEHVIPVSSKEVMLEFGSPFTEESVYNIDVTGVADLSGNIIKDYSNSFVWYFTKAFDIVINEIMADPDPSIELPSVEYVELYNASAYPVNLNNWMFIAGTNGESLSDVTIMPDSYLILCSEENVEYLTPFGKVSGIAGFPVLTNTGKTLILKNTKNHIISSVTYSDKWYKDDYKSEGGWSLEQIDPANPCGGMANWRASADNMGGTPGRANSVLGENPDFSPPGIRKAVIEGDNRLMVFFTEPCDSLTVLVKGNYVADHGFGNPDSVQLVAPHYSEALLFFGKPFLPKIIYTIELGNGIYDCAGNSSDNFNIINFGLPENPDSFDIIINEILFNPLLDGVDFVEIYNRSEKIIDLQLLNLATRDMKTNKIKSICPFSEEPALLFPSEYLAVTIDIPKLQEQYYFADPGALLQISDMPSFSNGEGKVILTDKRQQVLDEFVYNEDMHFPLLNLAEGVSLERINFDNPTNRESNWHSAAEDAGFGTPGYLNSQYSEYNESEKEIWLVPEVFSPDNDGVDDIVQIHFAFKDPGHVASVYIFDAKGRIIRHLIRNELLSVEGLVSWDGLDNIDQKAPIGIYLVYVEIFDLKGNIRIYKKTCVLAGRLRR